MNDDTLNRVLASEDELLPSSGFVSAVMERVRDEAVAPLPIPFPWNRVLPGFVLAAGVLGWGVVEFVRLGAAGLGHASPIAVPLPTGMTQDLHNLGWIALALGAALAGWITARRISGDSGLM
jgi:hypothetical protein